MRARRGPLGGRRVVPALMPLALVSATACSGPPAPPGGASGGAETVAAAEPFVDAAAAAGLVFHHFNGRTGLRYMAEVMGAGGALFDYDNDGDLDAYLVQGGPLAPGETAAQALEPPRHPLPLSDRLFRNDLAPGPDGSRRLRFTDVTEASGIARLARGYGMGVAAADYDGDGFMDLYVTRLGPNQLLRNRGNGTFEDVTVAAGAGDERWSVPAVFFDADGDGDLDLFVGNYVDHPFTALPACHDAAGRPDYCGPSLFRPLPDRLLRNRGDGTFEDATVAAGLGGTTPGRALGALASDFDGDGRSDLYVANDAGPNHLWFQQPGGVFREGALGAGAAVNGAGQAEGSMGVDAEDLDADGDLDLFMTHLVTETNTLFLDGGGGLFADRTDLAGVGAPSRSHTGFGTGFLDLENDGRLDLLVVNGAVQNIEALVSAGDPFPLRETDQLYAGRPPRQPGSTPRFAEVTAAAGAAFRHSAVSRGAVLGDVDNDGDTDVLVTHNGGPARLLLNRAADGSHWLGLRLLEGEPPRDALGARAALLAGGRPLSWRWVRTAGSYASARDPRVLFGLAPPGGEPPPVEGVRVIWPDGSVGDFPPPPLDRYTVLTAGGGRTRR